MVGWLRDPQHHAPPITHASMNHRAPTTRPPTPPPSRRRATHHRDLRHHCAHSVRVGRVEAVVAVLEPHAAGAGAGKAGAGAHTAWGWFWWFRRFVRPRQPN